MPDPDSPTTPRVWPRRRAKLTPSTALMWPTVRRTIPFLIGYHTLSSSAVMTSGAPAGAGCGVPEGSAAIRWRV